MTNFNNVSYREEDGKADANSTNSALFADLANPNWSLVNKLIRIGGVEYQGKQMDVKISSLNIPSSKDYIVTIDGYDPDYYSIDKNGKELLEWNGIVRGLEDVELEKNELYLWDKNLLWKVYDVKYDEVKKEFVCVLKKKLKYNPWKMKNEKILQKNWEDVIKIFDYENPENTRGDKPKWTRLILLNFKDGKDYEANFVHQEWVEFNRDSIRIVNGQEIWIEDVNWKKYRYDIRFWWDDAYEDFHLSERPLVN